MIRVEIPVLHCSHVSLTRSVKAVLAQTHRITVTGWFTESSALLWREAKTRRHAKRLYFSVHYSFSENYCLPFHFSILKITSEKNDSWLCLSSSDHPTSNPTSRESSAGNRHEYSHRNKIRYEQSLTPSPTFTYVSIWNIWPLYFSHLIAIFEVCILLRNLSK